MSYTLPDKTNRILGKCSGYVDAQFPWDSMDVSLSIDGSGSVQSDAIPEIGVTASYIDGTINADYSRTFNRVPIRTAALTGEDTFPDGSFAMSQLGCCCNCRWSIATRKKGITGNSSILFVDPGSYFTVEIDKVMCKCHFESDTGVISDGEYPAWYAWTMNQPLVKANTMILGGANNAGPSNTVLPCKRLGGNPVPAMQPGLDSYCVASVDLPVTPVVSILSFIVSPIAPATGSSELTITANGHKLPAINPGDDPSKPWFVPPLLAAAKIDPCEPSGLRADLVYSVQNEVFSQNTLSSDPTKGTHWNCNLRIAASLSLYSSQG